MIPAMLRSGKAVIFISILFFTVSIGWWGLNFERALWLGDGKETEYLIRLPKGILDLYKFRQRKICKQKGGLTILYDQCIWWKK
jgi:hypothetical protein